MSLGADGFPLFLAPTCVFAKRFPFEAHANTCRTVGGRREENGNEEYNIIRFTTRFGRIINHRYGFDDSRTRRARGQDDRVGALTLALLFAYAGVEVVGRVVAIVVARVAPQVVGRAHVVRVARRLAARLLQQQAGHPDGAAAGGDVCNTSRDTVEGERVHLTTRRFVSRVRCGAADACGASDAGARLKKRSARGGGGGVTRAKTSVKRARRRDLNAWWCQSAGGALSDRRDVRTVPLRRERVSYDGLSRAAPLST